MAASDSHRPAPAVAGDADLTESIPAAATPEKVAGSANDEGIPLSAEDSKYESAELSQAELENVNGGGAVIENASLDRLELKLYDV